MKAIRTLLVGMMMMLSTSIVAQPMNYDAMRNNARFLTDRMAYTLGISNLALIDDLYRINFDYIYGINEYLDDIALGYRYDDYMAICAERDYALQMLLGNAIWTRLMAYEYFYRPVYFHNHRWHFGVYDYFNRGHWYYSAPRYYHEYRGGHFFGRMQPNRGIGVRGPGMRDYRPGNNPGYHHNDRPNSYRGGTHEPNHGGGNMNREPNRGGYEPNRGGQEPNRGGNGGMNREPNRGGSMGSGEQNRGSYTPNRGGNAGERPQGSSSGRDSRSGGSYSGSSSSNRGSSYGGGSSSSSRSSSYGGGSSSSSSRSSMGGGSSSSRGGGNPGGHGGRR